MVVVFAMLPVILYCESKFLGGVLLSFWALSILRIAIAAVITAAVETIVIRSFQYSWLSLTAAGVGGIGTFTATLFITGYFTSSEKQLLVNLLAGKLGLRTKVAPS
jgi:ABC-type thiamin/hydroxymethylpyrimidine transport system permease subunit